MTFIIDGEQPKRKAEILYQQNNSGIQPITESSDMSETIRELNSDDINDEKFSSIDMKTRLESIEISSIIAVDSLVALDFLPEDVSFITRSKKRLAVSLKGAGRNEIVSIAQGIRGDPNATGNAFMNMFKPRQ